MAPVESLIQVVSSGVAEGRRGGRRNILLIISLMDSDGLWPCHIRLESSGPDAEFERVRREMEFLLKSEGLNLDRDEIKGVRRTLPHVSLSRRFHARHWHVRDLMVKISAAVREIPTPSELNSVFDSEGKVALKWFLNDQKTKVHLGILVDSHSVLENLTKRIDQVLAEYGWQSYYFPALFHVTQCSVLVPDQVDLEIFISFLQSKIETVRQNTFFCMLNPRIILQVGNRLYKID